MFRPVLAIIKLSRELDDDQYRPKHVVVSITVIKYTSVIKLCLTTYLFLVSLPTIEFISFTSYKGTFHIFFQFRLT